MRSIYKIVALGLFLALSLAARDSSAALPVAVEGEKLPSLAPVLERVTPSVVNVYTKTRVRVRSPLLDDPFFRRFFNVPNRSRERVSQSLGSGVVVDADAGFVLTNNHVIEGADDISVTLSDGRSFEAEVIGTDSDTDLAMIRISASELQALSFADSASLRVGDFVVAVGNPFGLGQTVTSGIVSALGRSAFRGLEYQNFIQTDASINPGNSGGALINLRGELVGINSAIFTPSGGNVGIGFAIPSSMAQYVMQQLSEYGEVRRGTLGIFVQDLTSDLAGAFDLDSGSGVLIADIDSESQAGRAGLQVGDVVTHIAGNPVGSAQAFHNFEGQFPLGDQVELRYLRDGKPGDLRVEVQAPDRASGDELDARLAGAVFEDVPMKLRSARVRGVLLTELEPDSRLARLGMRPGDIITGVNRDAVRDVDGFREAISSASGSLYLEGLRGGRDYVVRID